MNRKQAFEGVAFTRVVAETVSSRCNALVRLSDVDSVGIGGIRVFDGARSFDRSFFVQIGQNGWSDDKRMVWSRPNGSSAVCPDYVVTLGIKDFVKPSKRAFLSYDVAIASVLACAEHEARHVVQYEVARGHVLRPSDMPSAVVSSLIASRQNPVFRGANYSLMPHEIDAERCGVLSGYRTLLGNSNVFDVEHAMSGMLRRSSFTHIGPVRYDFVNCGFDEERFLSQMNDAFNDAVSKKRDVSSMSFRVMSSGDFAAAYFDMNRDDFLVFRRLKNGVEQDLYLAAISMRYHPEDREFFDSTVLSDSFSIPMPNGRSPIRSVSTVVPFADEMNRHRRLPSVPHSSFSASMGNDFEFDAG